jgi:N-acetylglucosaminyl-diphospho-decaprenol L-rhamnosyltransferase
MLDLAVVIVTWNNQDIIGNALQSLLDDLQTTALAYQVWVVDSASSDETVDLIRTNFPDVHLIACDENIGFGRANNLAMREIGFDRDKSASELPHVVYLLNPDTVTHQGATQTLYDILMNDDDVGGVGARLTFDDGSFQHSAFMFPDLGQIWTEFFPTPGRFIEGAFNGRYEKAYYQSDKPFLVDFTLGATMMLKRDVLMQTGLFDEDFLIYCEEVDWAWRIHKAGWNILCVPQAHVTHLGGQSTSQVRVWSVLNLWKSRLHLYDKHYPIWKLWLARRLVRLGMRRKISQLDPQTPNFDDILSAYQTIINMAKS